MHDSAAALLDADDIRRAYLGRTERLSDILAILPQQLVFGLALGTVYGLIALGYTMVYGVLFMINFAHGEVFMIGAYIGWGVLTVAARRRRSAGCIRSGCCR